MIKNIIYKQLLSDSAVYGAGMVSIKAISFLTLPIYTRIFSPEQFGAIEMLSIIGTFIALIMNSGMDSAQSYYFMEAKNKNNYDIRDITTAVLQYRLVSGVLIIGVVSALSPFIIDFSFDTNIEVKLLLIAVISIFFANLVNQSLEIFRLIYKPYQYIGLSLFQTLGNIGFILYFSYVKNMGVSGYFWGSVCGSFAALITGWFATREYRHWSRFEVRLWGILLRFGLPLVPAGLMMWIMRASDRWFVMNMLSSADVGIYAVAARFSAIMIVSVEVFRKAVWPIAMDMLHKDDGPKFFSNVSTAYILAGSVLSIAFTALSPFIIKLLAAPEYFESWKVLGILSWVSVFYGFYLFSGIGFFSSRRTYLTLYSYATGTVVNLILNYFLIRAIGIEGAAYSTAIGLLTANITSIILGRKLYSIKWRYGILATCITAGLLFTWFYTKLNFAWIT
ncbi:lipopolysaccharide biosynthesis protein [Limisalsivibrio acetivorans]|uniref:lipopolysaccharide biosynthesis protein n=1 Tax=Limisalsivibrio acetivorans TaxID=1304888 RepID=UPI0003B66803|nr:oligosaccharide flippase family protein [Limisalsivibrio acetivorans]